ncbi:NUDIX hydrolase [Tropicibacter oceani]|uniref:NUDIX hydrolase n=1 Tax=Tropicibacter oceani TaxID=3058420 RepID=A0ABY8QL62_9RHOB|nr:NUDIX hydrolase [Tropicibacter oceani]WGW05274.1 NUDIX hydrolase [Tropicibacter oceani]
MPKVGEQIAALPMRWDDDGNLKVLMVTSRDTGRWVMPKGWEMDGKKPWAAAEIEALEEAGAKGFISHDCIGSYSYKKKLGQKHWILCEVRVYPMIVEKLKRNWKERHQRKRKWFTPKAAAKRVKESELADLLMTLASKPKKEPIIRELLKKAS